MKMLVVALVLQGLAVQAGNTHDSGPLQHPHAKFDVSARRVGGDTEVYLMYPTDRNNIWTCVTFRRVADQSYEPRWCFFPESGAEHETVVIPRWPPDSKHGTLDKWELYAFLQFSVGVNDVNGYVMTAWKPLE